MMIELMTGSLFETEEIEIPSEDKPSHPFCSINPYTDGVDGSKESNEAYFNIGRVDATGILFTEDGFITFYVQEVKESDYDFVEIKISENTGLAFIGRHELFGGNEVLYHEELNDWKLPHYPNGYIQGKETVLYSAEAFTDEDTAAFVSTLTNYDVLSSFIEYGLFLVVNPTFISNEEPVEMQVRQATADLVSQLLKMPKFQTLMTRRILFSSNSNAFELDKELVWDVAISVDTLVSTDWDAFSDGVVNLNEDEFQVYK